MAAAVTEFKEMKEFSDIKQRILPLPDGKQYHFFIVAAEEDQDRVLLIVSKLREEYNVKCLYEATDCMPGLDKFEFIKKGMVLSAKIVLFVSPMFLKDSMCVMQQNMALAASLDERIPCIVPVLLDEVEDIQTLTTLKFVNTSNSSDDVVIAGIVRSVTGSDLHASMLPFECTGVFARFENGYHVEVPVKQEALLLNRPAKYTFHAGTEFWALINDSKMKIPKAFISDIVDFVNRQSILKTYDFLKKRNICCWGYFFMIPFTALACCLVSLIGIASTNTRERPGPDTYSFFSSGLESVLSNTFPQGFTVMFFVLLILIFVVPSLCNREKRDIHVQKEICKTFLKRCIENDVIIVFSGRANRRPKLRVVRYSFDKCRDFLENIIRRNGYTTSEESMTPREYADVLIADQVAEMSEIMSKDYDDIPDAPYNRHNVRKGKMCLCQQIEINLQVIRQSSQRPD